MSYVDGAKPAGVFTLALGNFGRQGKTIFEQIFEADASQSLPASLNFRLSNAAVTKAQETRENSGGGIEAHPVSRFLYDVGCLFLDELFDGRPIPRFWFLETIARIPYFSYVSMLHLYER